MCLLAVLARFGHRNWQNLVTMAKNSAFSKNELVRARPYELKVIEACDYALMKGFEVKMCF